VSEPTKVASLRLLNTHKVQERNRLRDARRAYTAQLGPMPAAAAIVIGLFSGLSEAVRGWWLVGALVPLFLMVAVGLLGTTRLPFRKLDFTLPEPTDSEEGWLRQAIEEEERVYREAVKGLEFERGCVFVVQGLLLAEVVYLVLVTAW
jgi:hypothetical protein